MVPPGLTVIWFWKIPLWAGAAVVFQTTVRRPAPGQVRGGESLAPTVVAGCAVPVGIAAVLGARPSPLPQRSKRAKKTDTTTTKARKETINHDHSRHADHDHSEHDHAHHNHKDHNHEDS